MVEKTTTMQERLRKLRKEKDWTLAQMGDAIGASRQTVSNFEHGKRIPNTGIFFETNLSSNSIISFVKDLLSKMELDFDDFSFSLSEAPFSLDNESTWAEGMLPVAKLFYNLIEDLIKKEKITETEIEELKTKDFTKSLFNSTDYPAIANSVDDNKGNSNHKRYRAKGLIFNNTTIYISTQFFESDRDVVIEWYKNHLQ